MTMHFFTDTQYFGDYVHILYLHIYYRTLCLFADGLLHIKLASGIGQPYLLFNWCSKVIRQTIYLLKAKFSLH